MAYTIEGIVKEIKVEKEIQIKISGTDGFSLWHKEEKYNVLFPNKKEKNPNCILRKQTKAFSVRKKLQRNLVQSNALGKHARLELEKKDSTFEIQSLTLLAD